MPVRAITDIDRLRRINEVLIQRIARSVDQQGNAFSLFQMAIALEGQMRQRTEELTQTLRRLELSNQALSLAKDAAEQANRSKTRFLAAASHDVLQPLNAAQLSMSALADLQTTAEGRHIAAQVQHALQTMDDLIRTLLDISRLDAGVVQPQRADIALGPLFQSLESDFRPLAQKRELKLRFRPTRAVIRTDRTMFRRALQNIVSNALRYTNKGGVLVGARRTGALTVISVSDTGQGIPPQDASTIYEEFKRGSLLPEEEGETGLGLGLSIVKRMVEALHHDLWFTSQVGRGTTFCISAPTVTIAPAPLADFSPRRGEPSSGLEGAKILLVENDRQVLESLTVRLRQWHCLIRSAQTTAGAMGQIETGWMPDLIIADQTLDAGTLGRDTIDRVRARAGRAVPAILVTASAPEDLAEASRAAGIELMLKPVKPAELRALMAHLLS